MSLCRFRDALGRPREGVHSIRLFDVAVVDVVLTLLVGWLVARWFFGGGVRATAACCALLFALGVIAHWAFCVDTRINRVVFS